MCLNKAVYQCVLIKHLLMCLNKAFYKCLNKTVCLNTTFINAF